MQSKYWPEWKRYLNDRGLASLASALLVSTRPLLPLFAQVMVLGQPFSRVLSVGEPYQAVIELLSDADDAGRFSQYLQGEGV